MIRRIATIVMLWSLFLTQGLSQEKRFRILEYNVENLFDTLHCEHKEDTNFTPQGNNHWDTRKYWSKLSKISRIIASACEENACDVVGLIEVENDSVVYDLTKRTKLNKLGYEYIITHSLDARGINVALLYQPARFKPLETASLRVSPIEEGERYTRDILHVMGETFMGDTLDFMLCHLPSKKGGKAASAYRSKVAQAIRLRTDSILHERQEGRLIIMGDFNAYYPEKIFEKDLRIIKPTNLDNINSKDLYLLTNAMRASSDIKGTYKFRGKWNQLDHFIVSGSLLKKEMKPYTERIHCKIVDLPTLLQKDKNDEGVHPYRTYLGSYYQGGYSDHLPILLELIYK